MAMHDFSDCVRSTLGPVADDWDEPTIAAVIELAEWFQSQEPTVHAIFGDIVSDSNVAVRAWISAIVTNGVDDNVVDAVRRLGDSGFAQAFSAIADCASEF